MAGATYYVKKYKYVPVHFCKKHRHNPVQPTFKNVPKCMIQFVNCLKTGPYFTHGVPACKVYKLVPF